MTLLACFCKKIDTPVLMLVAGLQAEAQKVTKVKEATVIKLKTVEKQRSDVEKARDELR